MNIPESVQLSRYKKAAVWLRHLVAHLIALAYIRLNRPGAHTRK